MSDKKILSYFIVACVFLVTGGVIGRYLKPSNNTVHSVRMTARVFKVTAYCPNECCCNRFADGITASGHKIKAGDRFCAAPKGIPFGTLIDIPNYGKVPVLDRGGAIKGNRIDVYFFSHEEALLWGDPVLNCEIAKK